MYSYEQIVERSWSKDRLVLSYTDAMELLTIYKDKNQKVVGWEAWKKGESGQLDRSEKYTGEVNLEKLSGESAIALIKCEIMQTYTVWEENDNAELLFHIKPYT